MTNQEWKAAVNGAAAFFAFGAAILWWNASRLTVPPSAGPGADGWFDAQTTITDGEGRKSDPFATGLVQSKWHKWAAVAASCAAALQGLALLFPDT